MKGSVYDTQKIADAEIRRDVAKDRLEHQDYAGCIRESQAAVELMIKALLEYLDVDYRLDHDMGKEIPKAIHKLEEALGLKPGFDSSREFEGYWIRHDLSRASIMSSVLSSIREYSVYGIRDAGIPASKMFFELATFTKECYEQSNEVIVRLGKMIRGLLSGDLQVGGETKPN